MENKFAEKVGKGLAEGLGEKLVGKLGEKLEETEEKILSFIVADKFATIASIAKLIGISTTAVEKNLVKLKDKGVLHRVGLDKGGHWELRNN